MAVWYELEIQVRSNKNAQVGPLRIAMEALEAAGWSTMNNKLIRLDIAEDEEDEG